MQRFTSPRRFLVVGICAAAALVVSGVLGYAVASGRPGTMMIAGPVCLAFLLVVGVRAARSHLDVDASGGTYAGFVRTRSWRWPQVRHVGRQGTYAVGSTGTSPAITFRGGAGLVLVALSDPRHPEAEDALIARCRELMDAAKGLEPSVAERLVEMLTEPPADPTADPTDGPAREG